MVRGFPLRLAGLAGFAGLLIACSAATVAVSPASAATQPHWSSAKLVPGVGGDWSEPFAVSCTGPGDCTAGGEYGPDEPYTQSLPFVANEASGTWRSALEVPGTSALNVKGSAEVDAVNCPVARDCAAAGDYLSKSGAAQFFVVYETAGTWRSAIEVPGLARLGSGADLAGAVIAGVSCAPATCEVGGTMNSNGVGGRVGFLVGEVYGRWGAPHPVPGTDSVVSSLSCPAAGDCAAGGTAGSPSDGVHGIVLDQVNGTWDKPVTVAPSVWDMTGEVTALSCAAARNCAAVGFLPEGWGGGPAAAVAVEAPS